ncbi:CoA transferase [Dehalococcoidia bacterium]|nr:CoA transferase [Dehalococcoidia bacterium]
MTDSKQALEGINVLDLTDGYSGGYCTKILRDLGAEVIKVELPIFGDATRSIGPYLNNQENIETSAPFLYLNAGKKSVTLDLYDDSTSHIVAKLISRCDILVENFRPETKKQLGFNYDQLSVQNDSLIMASLTYFGQTGPYSNFRGADLVSFAMSGYMYLTGDEDKEPLKAGGRQAEYQCGLSGAMAIVASLIGRNLTGLGQHIDVSSTEALTSTFDGVGYFHSYENTTVEPMRAGTRLISREPESPYPSTLLPCKDGWVHIHYSPSNPEGIAFLTQNERLADDEILGKMRGHADEIDELITAWLKDHTREEIQTLAQEVRVPFTMVQNIEETMSDPQNSHRDFFVELTHPIAGTMKYPTSPFRLKSSDWQTASAPLLGEHNDEVFKGSLRLTESDQKLIDVRNIT